MNPSSTRNQPYAGLSPSIGAQSHTLYFMPLEELQKSLRTDASNIVVVTFIGRSSHTKTLLANLTIDQSAFLITEEDWVSDQLPMSQLEAYYDRQHATIYISLLSLCEDSMFLSMCEALGKALDSAKNAREFDVEAWIRSQELAEAKLLLHAFLLSHIVFLVQDTPEIDVQWLDLLKSTAQLHSLIAANAEKVKFPLPTFKRLFEGPKPTLAVVCDITSALTAKNFTSTSDIDAYVQEAQKTLDLQAKQLLRRSQFDCLFQLALPQYSNLVFLGHAPMETVQRMITGDLPIPISDASRGVRTLRKWLVSKARILHGTAHFLPSFVQPTHTQSDGDTSKRRLKGPSKTLADGYLLPTSQEWFELSHSLLSWLSVEPLMASGGTDPDFLFSEECCRHALECARSTYFVGLTNIYGSLYHEKRLELALRVFSSLARGPAAFSAKSQLLAECTTYWNNGHRKCDSFSVTNRPCIHSYHLTKDLHSESGAEKSFSRITAELAASAPSYSPSSQISASHSTTTQRSSATTSTPQTINSLLVPQTATLSTSTAETAPTMAHSSGFKSLHRCNCGKNQTTRFDAFDLQQANTAFFSNPECCRYLPSLLESHLAMMRSREKETDPENIEIQKSEISEDIALLAMPHSLRQVNLGWEATIMGSVKEAIRVESENSVSPTSTSNISPDSASTTTSCTKLVGQSGFVEGYATLMPWKVISSNGPLNTGSSASITSDSGQVASTGGHNDLTLDVMAYIGMEYECHAGHRFFASPQVLAALGLIGADFSQGVDMQHLLETSYLPIYTTCACGKKTAQLQRLYVATPRDPSVRITFNPLVQVLGKSQVASEFYPLNADEGEETPETGLPRIHLESGIPDHLILPQDQLVCIRLPYIYSYQDRPLLQEKMLSNSECRFFLEPHSFGLVTT